MSGEDVVDERAPTLGYKRYGVLGAVSALGAGLVGYLAAKRAVEVGARGGTVDPAFDPRDGAESSPGGADSADSADSEHA